jgi:hypothetical protein
MRCSTSEIIKKGNHFEDLPPCAQGTITIAHNLSFIDRRSMTSITTAQLPQSAFAAAAVRLRHGPRAHLVSPASAQPRPGQPTYHSHLPVNADTVH